MIIYIIVNVWSLQNSVVVATVGKKNGLVVAPFVTEVTY